MTICILGKNLTALLVSKILVNKGLNVDIFFRNKNKKKILELLAYQIIVSIS